MRKVLITGASDGIGKSIALKLAKDGYELILCGRDKKRLESVAKECSGTPQVLAFDLNDTEQRTIAVEAVKDLDVLINNAGVWQKVGNLESLSDEKIIEIINTNLTSQIIFTKALLPQLKDKPGALIINVSSKSGVTAQEGQSVYSASKWGMKGFTDVLAEDTKDNEVAVSGVYQSGTNTKMFAKAGDDFPVDSFTEPDDLADVVAFMLSRPKKLWIKEIHVDK